MTKIKITNFDASRNLNGRRIRDEKNEKMLRKWYQEKLIHDDKINRDLKDFKKF